MLWAMAITGLLAGSVSAVTSEVEVAELNFDSRFANSLRNIQPPLKVPAWIVDVTQSGGEFMDTPRCWHASGPEVALGRLTVTLDRKLLAEDVVLNVLYEGNDKTDFAVQLFDAENRVVSLDLFGNLLAVGKEAKTDCFVVPLRRFPTATKITLRRIRGDVKVYGLILFPVVGEADADIPTMQALVKLFGDSLSPEHPLLKGVQQLAQDNHLALRWNVPQTDSRLQGQTGALPPSGTAPKTQLDGPANGLVAYWSFDSGHAVDDSGHGHHGTIYGHPKVVDGRRGQALRFSGRKDWIMVEHAAELDLKEQLTVAAWVTYAGLKPNFGSAIVWWGNRVYGHDPYDLHLGAKGHFFFRTDRSVTSKPVGIVIADEQRLLHPDRAIEHQHLVIDSPAALQSNTWYFVAATCEKVSAAGSRLKLWLNGELVREMTTAETVDYPTRDMWLAIGATDYGTWQNFHGIIDEVRLYNRALTQTEIQNLSK